jgi:hypothetical protein
VLRVIYFVKEKKQQGTKKNYAHEEIHNSYYFRDIVRVPNKAETVLTCSPHMRKGKEYNILVRKIQEKRPTAKSDVNYNIILKFILEELGVKLPAKFKYFRTWSRCRINTSFHLMNKNILNSWFYVLYKALAKSDN